MKTHPDEVLAIALERSPAVRQALIDRAVYTEEEAAVFCNISVSFLRKAREGLMSTRDEPVVAPPYIRIGRSVRYRKSDLIGWLDQFPTYRHRGEHD